MYTFNQSKIYRDILCKYFPIFILLLILSLGYPLKSIVFPKILVRIFDKLNSRNFNNSLVWFFFVFALIYLVILVYELVMILVIKVNVKKDILDICYKKIFLGLEESYTEIPGPNVFSNIFHFSTGGQSIFSFFFSCVFPYFITCFFVGLYLYFKVKPSIGIAFILINLFLFILPFLYLRFIKKKSKDLVEFRNQTEINIFDIFWNIYNIFSSNQQTNELKKIDSMTDKIKDLTSKRWKTVMLSTVIGRVIMIFFVCIIINIIFNNYKSRNINKTTLSNLVLIIVFVVYEFFYSYYIWHTLIVEILEQDLMLDEINKSLVNLPSKNSYIGISNKKKNSILEIKNLGFSYNKETPIFKNINLNFETGISYSIVGNIGCGKTSFLKILFGIYKPDTGDIILNKKIHRNITKNSTWRKYFNYLEQKPVLFGRSIEENIQYGNNKKKTDDSISKYGLTQNINKIKKEKQKTKLKKLGEGLSGGQRQIINLLRIITDPKDIILMDEPTSSLDPSTKKLFYKMFRILKKKGKTIIVITHDMQLSKLCDKTINFSSLN